MPWETEFLPYMKTHWKQGEHVCLVAPTGEGKTVFETQLIGRLRRFVLIFDAKGDDATLDELERDGQVLFRYVRPDGEPALEPDDPANPNGSLRAIAGVCNAAGNVAVLMPHPERMSESILGSDDGMQLIGSFVESARAWETGR